MLENFSINLMSIPVFLTSLLFFVLIFLSYRRENKLGRKFFCLLLLSCFLFSLFSGLEISFTSLEKVVLFFNYKFVGGVFLAPLLWTFSVEFSGETRYLNKKILFPIFGIAIVFLALVFTNSSHGLFYNDVSIQENAYYFAIYYTPGILYWLYSLYNVVLIFLSIILLFKMIGSVPRIYVNQLIILLIGTLIPWTVHIIDLLGFSPGNIDTVPFALAASALFIYYGLLKYELFQSAPIAFKTIFENLVNGILILDSNGKIIAHNKSALTFFPDSIEQNSLSKTKLLQNWPKLSSVFDLKGENTNLELNDPEHNRILNVNRENGTLYSDKDVIHCIFIRDITLQKASESIIKENELKLKNVNASLLRNEKMLKSIALATKELLSNPDFYKATQNSIIVLGEGAEVDRAYLFENNFEVSGKTLSSQRFEWSASGVPAEIDNPELQGLPLDLFGEGVHKLLINKVYQAVVSQIKTDEGLKELLESQDIKSIILIPIFVEDYFWGFVGFDDCNNERQWSEAETALLLSFADCISNAIQRKNLEENLFLSMQQAKEASNAKSEFLANMSHEIRTPLNGVLGFSDLLRRSEVNETQKEYLKSVMQSGHLLLELINDILDFSKIEAGKMEISESKVNLKQTAHEVLNVIRPIAEEKNLDLKLSLDPQLYTFYFFDETRLKQVLINLLSNAVKFSHQGKVELTIGLKSPPDNEISTLEFEVRDTGIGISKEKKQVIFEAFAQEDNSTTRKYGGTGLGLTISKKLLELMDSELKLETEVGKGSKFSFQLNLKHISGIPNAPVPAEKTYQKPLKQKISCKAKKDCIILLADDNPVNMLLAKTMVKKLIPGTTILEAVNGLEAVEYFRSNKPDLIFMDIQMPEMSGYEATKAIRLLEPSKVTPIIALTAGTVKGEHQRCLDAGMDDYLSKPVLVADIARMLDKYLDRQNTFEENQSLSKLDEFRHSDPGFFKELLMISLENLQKQNHELFDYYREGNFKMVKQTAHAIKGLGLNLDFKNLVLLVSEVENASGMQAFEGRNIIREIQDEINLLSRKLEAELAEV